MKKLAIALGVLAAMTTACGSGDDSTSKTTVGDSGPDSTTEGGGSEAGPDSTTEAAAGDDASDAGEAGASGDGAIEAASTEGGPSEGGASCMAFDAGALDDAAVAAGFAFITATGHCNRCHQASPEAGILLSGNTNSITDAGPVFPPNLTPDPATGLGCWSNEQIASAILFGNDPAVDGGKLCRLMPQFGVGKGDAAAPLDTTSVLNVVAALRSLAAVSNSVPMTMCPGLSTAASPDAGDAGRAWATLRANSRESAEQPRHVSDDDQRREPRYACRLSAVLLRGKRSVDVVSENVSFGGIFLRMSTPLSVRELVEIELLLPPDNRAVRLRGMVAHTLVRGRDAERAPGIGVELRTPGDEARGSWERFVRSLQPPAPPHGRAR